MTRGPEPAEPSDPRTDEGPARTDPGEGAARTEPAALLPLLALTLVWCWWGAKSGGFFSTVWLPGTVALCAVVTVLAFAAPWRASLRISSPVAIALGATLALGAWACLSAVWSPAPDLAIADGQRIFAYALSFTLGLWLCNLLGTRMHLALVPLAIAGAFAGAFALGAMLSGDDLKRYLEIDGTLQYPLGYRNANAAFFLIAFWSAFGLASRASFAWPLRTLAFATSTLCLDLALLSQSRGSVLGMGVACVVYLALTRDRARALVWLVLVALPVSGVIPAATDIIGLGDRAPAGPLLDAMRDAGRAVALTTLLAIGVGAIAALLDGRMSLSQRATRTANRAAAVILVALALAGTVAFVVAAGNPADWVGQRVSEFRSGQEPTSGARLTVNAGSGRVQLWRIALVDFRDDPILGEGAGGYRYSYLLERHANTQPAVRDAHSVELENLSELGLPGLLLLLVALGSAGAAVARSRRLGPASASLSAVALATGAYWLVHSSVDWFWPYPGVTAPVFALLGAAAAAPLRVLDLTPFGRGRLVLAAAAVVLAIFAIPPFLSIRYQNAAYDVWSTDTAQAYRDLSRSRDLNPLSVDPILAEGAIARAAGDRSRSIAAFQDAVEKRPEEWVSHYFLAQLYRRTDPERARAELAAAKARDPHNLEIAALEERLRAPAKKQPQ